MAPKPRASNNGPASRRQAPNPNALFSEEAAATGTKRDAIASGSSGGPSSAPPSSPSAAEHTQHFKGELSLDAKLVVERGLHAGKVLKLGAGTIVIGRSSKCDLSLKGSPGVSRRHTKIQLVGDRYLVLDLESRNGSIVNGKQVSRQFLNDGDMLEVCDEHIRFVARAGKAAPLPVEDIEDRPTQLVAHTTPRASSPTRSSKPPPLPSKRGAPQPFVDKTAPAQGLAGFDAPSALSDKPKRPPETRSHFVDVPRDIDDGTRTAPLAQPRLEDFDEPLGQPDLDDDSLPKQKPRPPPRPTARPTPRPTPAPSPRAGELSSPYVHGTEGPKRGGLSAMHVLAALAVLVVMALGAAAADTLLGPRMLLRWLHGGALPDDAPTAAQVEPQVPSAAPAPAPPTAPAADAAVEAKPAEAAKPIEAATPGEAATPIEAANPVEPPQAATTGAVVEVKAAAAGKVARVAVAVGDRVRASTPLAWLEGGGNPKKLAALRDEERDFAAAAKKGNKQAEHDLDLVRAGIAELERAGRGHSLTAGHVGAVVEVMVKPGDKVEVGQVIARVQLPGA